MNKEYFKRYYEDHKEDYRKNSNRWNKEHPEGKKKIKNKYYKEHREELLEYAREYQRKKAGGNFVAKRVRVMGLRIKEKELKPFLERISPELQAKIKENTKVNDKKIKHFKVIETRDTYMVRNILNAKKIKI